MSAAERVSVQDGEPAVTADGARNRRTAARWGRHRLPGRFLRSELYLIFGRLRNWAGLGVLVAVPVLVTVSVSLSSPASTENGPGYFSAILENGLFVAIASLAIELPVFLPLAVAAISADAVAGEAGQGTLRYLLAVPVSRTRMLAVKYLAVVLCTVVATALVAVVGAVCGLIAFGGGEATLPSGDLVPLGEVFRRLLLVSGYLAVGLCALGAVGLFVSTLTEQPVGATIAIVVADLTSYTLDTIPQLDWLHPYLLTHYWPAFSDLLLSPIPTQALTRGLLCSGVYALVFWTAAWAWFSSRDVTS